MKSNVEIRPAIEDEFDEITRVWMASWESTGLSISEDASFEDLRARLPRQIAEGWELFAARTGDEIVGMLAFYRQENHLDQLFIAPEYQARGHGSALLAFARKAMPDEIWLRTTEANIRACRWYEREGFVLEKTVKHKTLDRMMAHYRWIDGN